MHNLTKHRKLRISSKKYGFAPPKEVIIPYNIMKEKFVDRRALVHYLEKIFSAVLENVKKERLFGLNSYISFYIFV